MAGTMIETKRDILIVDDDPSLLRLLGIRLQTSGYQVRSANSGPAALGEIAAMLPALVISDLRLDERDSDDVMNGMELLNAIQRKHPGLPVILLTAHGTIPDAVQATQDGAFGFLTKPINKDELLSLVERAMAASAAFEHYESSELVTQSPLMIELLNQVKQVAKTESSVLLRGGSGTGKELVARILHRASSRSDAPFVPINCGAMPEQLLEAELFGYRRGAFTGAVKDHPGLLQTADGGTLFLDEVGDMPVPLQIKLLRVLQERCVRPLGGVSDRSFDARVISATHRDLNEAIQSGEFREDLYYRLNVVEFHLPDLDQRREDIPLLVQHALQRLAAQQNAPCKVYAPEALETLVRASWPGNVRQLLNVVEQNVALSIGPVINAALVEKALGNNSVPVIPFNRAREDFTRNYLVQLLTLTQGNVARAARLAKRNRTDFYKLLNKHQISADRFKATC
jgi:two-component system response regulator GlrR